MERNIPQSTTLYPILIYSSFCVYLSFFIIHRSAHSLFITISIVTSLFSFTNLSFFSFFEPIFLSLTGMVAKISAKSLLPTLSRGPEGQIKVFWVISQLLTPCGSDFLNKWFMTHILDDCLERLMNLSFNSLIYWHGFQFMKDNYSYYSLWHIL